MPSVSRSCWIDAQWLMPATTGGIAIRSGSTPAWWASHSRLLGCPVQEQSAYERTCGAAARIASASIGAGLV